MAGELPSQTQHKHSSVSHSSNALLLLSCFYVISPLPNLQVALEEIVCHDSIDFIDILATPCSKSVCLLALHAMMQYCFSMLLNQLPVETQPLPLSAPPPVLTSIEWQIVCAALSLLEKFAADSHFKIFFSSAITKPMLLFLVRTLLFGVFAGCHPRCRFVLSAQC
jgi:hypothetical protein